MLIVDREERGRELGKEKEGVGPQRWGVVNGEERAVEK